MKKRRGIPINVDDVQVLAKAINGDIDSIQEIFGYLFEVDKYIREIDKAKIKGDTKRCKYLSQKLYIYKLYLKIKKEQLAEHKSLKVLTSNYTPSQKGPRDKNTAYDLTHLYVYYLKKEAESGNNPRRDSIISCMAEELSLTKDRIKRCLYEKHDESKSILNYVNSLDEEVKIQNDYQREIAI